jgi:hypothetical protein
LCSRQQSVVEQAIISPFSYKGAEKISAWLPEELPHVKERVHKNIVLSSLVLKLDNCQDYWLRSGVELGEASRDLTPVKYLFIYRII